MLTITLLGTAATMPLPDRALSTAFAACVCSYRLHTSSQGVCEPSSTM